MSIADCNLACGSNVSQPFASEPFAFETFIDEAVVFPWFERNWTWSLKIIGVYVLLLTFLQRWMRTRESFRLEILLACWNMALALFSIIGTARVIPELTRILLMEEGFYSSICDSR